MKYASQFGDMTQAVRFLFVCAVVIMVGGVAFWRNWRPPRSG